MISRPYGNKVLCRAVGQIGERISGKDIYAVMHPLYHQKNADNHRKEQK